jgi:SpoVK/Ycf46/Vps4 family AAA+-type ATPase
MASIFEQPGRHKVFLVCGKPMNDMFMADNLLKCGFQSFLNSHLRSIGFNRIVYYSGAKNVGKYVLDDESAILSINSNKQATGEAASTQPPQPRRRFISPRRKKDEEKFSETMGGTLHNETAERRAPAAELVYSQPKLYPAAFLAEAKALMDDTENRSAIVFTFMSDFLKDTGNPLQPYVELLSQLWVEYQNIERHNICIFLANGQNACDVADMLDKSEYARPLKNYFFNEENIPNEETVLELGLPNMDEICFLLDHMRIVGSRGKRIAFPQARKRKLASNLVYFSREADGGMQDRGGLRAIFEELCKFIANSDSDITELRESDVCNMYSDFENVESDPLEKLRTTRGWESVYKRVSEIVNYYKGERDASVAGMVTQKDCASDRIRKAPVSVRDKIPRDQIPSFVLKGNPGVGKTTIAKFIGRALFDAGILNVGHTVVAGQEDIIDRYVGGTSHRVRTLIDSAHEGVLFIDEAYSLIEKSEQHNYAQQAVDTIVGSMTNPAHRYCLIMGGYSDKMDDLLKMNDGWHRRFGNGLNILTIPDYEPDLLKNIFLNACKGKTDDRSLKVDESLDLDIFFSNMYDQRNRKTFGNAGAAIGVADDVIMKAKNRGSKIIEPKDFDDQYKGYFTPRGADSIDAIMAEMEGYVGFGHIKKLLESYKEQIALEHETEERVRLGEIEKDKKIPPPDHFIFAGNPGTGKTTAGVLMGRFLHQMDILGNPVTMKVDASELLGTHGGDGPKKMAEKIQEAIDNNAVLFIDEAYQIIDSLFSQEIVGAMLGKMTDRAGEFKVIFGMYANRVDEFLALNDGLSRRLQVVMFPDYTPEQLFEIFGRLVKKGKFSITQEALADVKREFDVLDSHRGGNFGNAGTAEKFFGEVDKKRCARADRNALGVSDARRTEIIREDVQAAISEGRY